MDRDEYLFIARFETEALEAARQAREAMEQLGDQADKTGDQFEDNADAFDSTAEAMAAVAEAGALVTAAYLSIRESAQYVTSAISEYAQTETQMVAIAKVTSLTKDEMDQLQTTFENNAAATGVLFDTYTELAAVAGQLGIDGVANLEKFSIVSAQVASASDLSAADAGMEFARMLSLAGENIQDIERLGSVVVQLGNNVKATESQIVGAASEIARATTSFGTSSTFSSALGAAMAEVGLRAEVSGTSVGRLFSEIALAASKGGEDLKRYSDLVGLTGKQFKALAQSKPQEAFLKVLEALSKQKDVIGVLDELGLANAESLKSLTPLITGYERLVDVLEMAEREAANPTAAAEEAAAAQATLALEYQALLNAIGNEVRQFGEALEPVARDVVHYAREMLAAFNELEEPIQNTMLAMLAATPAILGVAGAIKGITLAIRALKWAGLIGGATAATGAVAGTTTAVGLLGGALRAALGPIGLFVAAAWTIYELMEYGRDGMSAVEEAADTVTTAIEEYRAALDQAATEEKEFGEATSGTTKLLEEKTQALRDAAQALRDAALDNSTEIAGRGASGGRDFTDAFEQIRLEGALSTVTGGTQSEDVKEFLGLLQGVVDTRGQDIEMVKLLIIEEQRIADMRKQANDALTDYEDARAQAREEYLNGDETARQRLVEEGRELADLAEQWDVAGRMVQVYRDAMASGDLQLAAGALGNIQDALQEQIGSFEIIGGSSVQNIVKLATEIHNAFLEAELLTEAADGNVDALARVEAGGVSAFGAVGDAAAAADSIIAQITGTINDVSGSLGGLLEQAKSVAAGIFDTLMGAVGGAYEAPSGDLASLIKSLGNASSGTAASAALLRQFEGFRATPYWDVNALRTGYGSDTITLADGTIKKVTEGMRVSVADANRDLVRRVGEFQDTVRGQVGSERFNSFTPAQQAALTSIAYNYGSLPERIINAVKVGTNEQIGSAILTLRGDNDGINSKRRTGEASIFLDGVGVDQQALAQEREAARIAAEKQREAEREAAEAAREAAKAAKEAAEEERERIRVRKEFLDTNGELISQLEFEESLVGKSVEEQAKLRKEYELINEAKAKGIALDAETRASIAEVAAAEGQAAAAQEQRTEAQERANEAQQFYNQQQEALQEGIIDAILEGKNLVDTLANIAKAFARAALQAALFGSGPLSGMFGGGGGLLGGLMGMIFPNAKGNVIDSGGIVPNAKGNVVTSSIIVPMAKGGRALIGEAGPEGILPLERAPDGRLGVIAMGGGAPGAQGSGGIGTLNYQPTFVIQSDGNVSGGGGEDQQNALMSMLDSAVRERVLEVLQDQMRNGGVLNPGVKTY